MVKDKFTFEEIFEQNERRIHYHLHKLNIRDPHQEFYQEGIVAMWNAYENYQPDKGPLSTYFNFTIRHRLIDLIRKENRRLEMEELAPKEEDAAFESDVYHKASLPASSEGNPAEHITNDFYLWQKVKELLTEKQWKWVRFYIIEGMTLREIAEQEGVSIEAVKSWAKEARKRLRSLDDFGKLLVKEEYP
ncbi:sigma-70 family RNA polymerase sigma factor [Oceanobacillus chungangensis]|uniref:Sigma-70 family RNA polymerase sigma factor n=1 Tax=Oceanobacillus chungangensis TaxID=1229152 RepID=A0A3D8PZI2_9BACI|nr:sigma-70 family RNA polymerase sigma factor [Oceanobacillus chungangensis]RDW20761.1 sigma-70 family RNA polymerase sigma factor [Oceanobacillus chungangensis]